MGAETAGRKLGIGLRLAARAAKERATQAAGDSRPSGGSSTASPARISAKAVPVAAAQVSSRARGIAAGTKRFGEAVWGPMAHTGSVLWLEITGLFFALFAAFFGQSAYKSRGNWKAGSDHIHFGIYAALTVLFSIFTLSQFYRARQREKKNRARRAAAR
jgi:hypothetical protein